MAQHISSQPRYDHFDNSTCIFQSYFFFQKSLKKLFNELKIDVEKRATVPVLCDDVGVIGVYGYCVDERVRVKDDTSRVLLFNIHLEDNN